MRTAMTRLLTSNQLNDLGAANDNPSDGSLRTLYYQHLAAAENPYRN